MENIIKLSDFRCRDPFILTDFKNHKYYFYYSKMRDIICLESTDLTNWENPKKVFENNGEYNLNWAPEFHYYRGSYYWLATLRSGNEHKGCYIFRADKPYGLYKKHSQRITPPQWSCLDGTLYVDDNGNPYMVFCHEYIDFADRNGEMRVVKLKSDLTAVDGESILLFKAKDNAFSTDGITDGPFIYRAENGDLVMLWSKYKDSIYAVLTARSKNGIMGPWIQDEKPLFSDNGGHAMVFSDLNGNKKITFHVPNSPNECERAVIFDFSDHNGELSISSSD